MSSLHIERLETLLRSPTAASQSEVRNAVDRLQAELSERLARESSDSMDYFLSAYRVLRRIKGTAHAEARLDCLLSCCSFFFFQARYAETCESVSVYHALATQAASRPAAAKSWNLMAIVNAELGNLGEALAQYSKALEISHEIG